MRCTEIVRRLDDLIEFEKSGDRWDSVTVLMQVRAWLVGMADDPTPTQAAHEFAAKQLREAARWAEANGYDDAAIDHLIRRAGTL